MTSITYRPIMMAIGRAPLGGCVYDLIGELCRVTAPTINSGINQPWCII